MKGKIYKVGCPHCGCLKQVRMVLGEERVEECLECGKDFWVLWSDPLGAPGVFLGLDEFELA